MLTAIFLRCNYLVLSCWFSFLLLDFFLLRCDLRTEHSFKFSSMHISPRPVGGSFLRCAGAFVCVAVATFSQLNMLQAGWFPPSSKVMDGNYHSSVRLGIFSSNGTLKSTYPVTP